MHPNTSTTRPRVDACTHGEDCPVHPGARSVHNFDPACGQAYIHPPHLIAVVDFEGLTTAAMKAADVPVFSTSLCGGGLDPQHRARCGRADQHGPHLTMTLGLAPFDCPGVA